MPPERRTTSPNRRELQRLGERIESVDDGLQDLRERVDRKIDEVAERLDRIDARQDLKFQDFRKETATAFAEVRRDMGEIRDLVRNITNAAEQRITERVVTAAASSAPAAIADAVNPLFRKWGGRGGWFVCGVAAVYEVVDKSPKVLPVLGKFLHILAGQP